VSPNEGSAAPTHVRPRRGPTRRGKAKVMITPHSTGHGPSLTSCAACPDLGPTRTRTARPSSVTSDASRRTITVDGARVAYRDEGTGEVLLLIHGLGGSSYGWRAVLPTLSKKYRVIAPDLPGHGLSDPPRDYSPATFAVWLRDLLDALGIPTVTMVGHSLGGAVAMQFAHQHRDYCRRLILLSSGGLGSEVSRMLRMLSLPGARFVLPLLASRPKTDESTLISEPATVRESLSIRRHRQAFLHTLRAAVDRRGQKLSALDYLRGLADLPAQIIFGESDEVIPVAHAYAAHDALAGSHLHVIPWCRAQPPAAMPRHRGRSRRLLRCWDC
jgi:pimeloyl-ACP methyl ester carboxylesterase